MQNGLFPLSKKVIAISRRGRGGGALSREAGEGRGGGRTSGAPPDRSGSSEDRTGFPFKPFPGLAAASAGIQRAPACRMTAPACL
jgi:hypothetical protein